MPQMIWESSLSTGPTPIKTAIWVPVIVSLVSAIASWAGAYYTWSNKGRELDIRMVEISLSILKGENKGTQTAQARRFALRALRQYSNVSLTDKDLQDWAENGDIEFGQLPYYSPGYTDYGYKLGYDNYKGSSAYDNYSNSSSSSKATTIPSTSPTEPNDSPSDSQKTNSIQ